MRTADISLTPCRPSRAGPLLLMETTREYIMIRLCFMKDSTDCNVVMLRALIFLPQ